MLTGLDLRYASIAELAAAFRRRDLSPVEFTRGTLERAAALDRRLTCFITRCSDEAMAAAREAERELVAGTDLGPLHGVPFTLKDVFATRGVRTTAGSRLLENTVPDFDATAVERLKAAGAILIGKCNTSEFAAGPETKNIHFGFCHNPWDEARMAGGSSGGSAAAVAAGLGVFSLGSDTGGSIRIPAAACGVVGFKPTYGRVSKFGVTAHAWSLDTCGPLARYVEDAAIVLEVIAGHDVRDPSTSRRPVEPYAQGLTGDVRGLRVGIPKESVWDRLDPEVETAVRAAVDVLFDLGARVEEISMPWLEHVAATNNVISWVEASVYHASRKNRWVEYGEEMQQRALMGQAISAADYLAAQRARRAILERARACFERVEVLATPTTPVPAPRLDVDTVEVGPLREPTRSVLGRLTRFGSLTGFPSLAVPCGFTRGGLPVSLHLVAAPFRDSTALRVGHAYQQATDWHLRRPPSL